MKPPLPRKFLAPREETKVDKLVDFLNSDDRTPEGSKNVLIMLLIFFIIMLIFAFSLNKSGSGGYSPNEIEEIKQKLKPYDGKIIESDGKYYKINTK